MATFLSRRVVAATASIALLALLTATPGRAQKPEMDEKESAPDKGMLDLAGQLIEQNVGELDPDTFKDRYQEALLEVVKAKVKGEKPVIATAPERGNVVNLMDALAQSLEQGDTKKPPARSKAKPAAKKPATKRKRA